MNQPPPIPSDEQPQAGDGSQAQFPKIVTRIGYKDFFPEVLKSGFFSTTHETLAATVARANHWIGESGVQVLNVETVVLPNVNGVEEASDVGIRTSGEMSSYWYQVVRVWYQVEAPGR